MRSSPPRHLLSLARGRPGGADYGARERPDRLQPLPAKPSRSTGCGSAPGERRHARGRIPRRRPKPRTLCCPPSSNCPCAQARPSVGYPSRWNSSWMPMARCSPGFPDINGLARTASRPCELCGPASLAAGPRPARPVSLPRGNRWVGRSYSGATDDSSKRLALPWDRCPSGFSNCWMGGATGWISSAPGAEGDLDTRPATRRVFVYVIGTGRPDRSRDCAGGRRTRSSRRRHLTGDPRPLRTRALSRATRETLAAD